MTVPPKILFIGIDGAEPDLIQQWSEAGVLPTLQSLHKSAAWRPTTNLPGLGSDAMWTSLFTGVSPGNHGRYFYRQLRRGTYRAELYQASDAQPEPFWNSISRANRRVAIIDVPYSPLAKDLNGIQLVDWLAHDRKYPRVVTWPPALASKVTAQFGVDTLGLRDKHGRGSAEFNDLRDRLLGRIKTKAELLDYYLGEGKWDLFMAVFHDGHDAGHNFWHLHDPTHPQHDATFVRSFGDPIKDVYVAIDAAIGRLLDRAGPDTTVIIFIGPGMGPNYTGNFLLDDVLRCLEYGPAQPNRAVDPVRSIFRKMPSGVRNFFKDLAASTDELLLARDRNHRKCFAVPHNEISGAIRINLVGRDPRGQINPGTEYESFCEALTRDLLDLVNLDTGKPLIQKVLRAADLYQGDYLDDFPDLFVVWPKDAPISSIGSPKVGEIKRTYPGSRTGDHTSHCLLFARGPSIEAGELSQPYSVLDLAPTIASLLGVPLPKVEGTPITGLGAGERRVRHVQSV